MDCKTQVMAGLCVFWVNTRCLVVVRRQNTTRAAGRRGVGQYVLFVQAYGGDRSAFGQYHRGNRGTAVGGGNTVIQSGMGADTRVVLTERAVKEDTMEADRTRGMRTMSRMEDSGAGGRTIAWLWLG